MELTICIDLQLIYFTINIFFLWKNNTGLNYMKVKCEHSCLFACLCTYWIYYIARNLENFTCTSGIYMSHSSWIFWLKIRSIYSKWTNIITIWIESLKWIVALLLLLLNVSAPRGWTAPQHPWAPWFPHQSQVMSGCQVRLLPSELLKVTDEQKSDGI